MNFIEYIDEQIQTDDSINDKQIEGSVLIIYYDSLPQDKKDILDKVFIILCGYSMGTLIENYQDDHKHI